MKITYSKKPAVDIFPDSYFGSQIFYLSFLSVRSQTCNILITQRGKLMTEEVRGLNEGLNEVLLNLKGLKAGKYKVTVMTVDQVFNKEIEV